MKLFFTICFAILCSPTVFAQTYITNVTILDVENQKLIGPSPEATQQEIPDKTANYSQGFPVLYQEVHDFIKNRYQDRLDEYFSKSAKIHLIFADSINIIIFVKTH